MLQSRSVWQALQNSDLGFLNILSDLLTSIEKKHIGAYPSLRKAECLFVGSDYGGEHSGAAYQTISFLISDMADCASWQSRREGFRARYLLDGRRMAFKNLNDVVRQRALDSFLNSANQLPGLLAVFAIAKSVQSLFLKKGRLKASDLEMESLCKLSPPVAEKLLRVVHLLALLIAGLSAPSQDLLWVTDEDTIAANANRVRILVDVFARVSSHCLPHGMRHMRVATSKQDKGDLSVEDILSITDIAAGGISAVMEKMLGTRGAPLSGFFLPAPTDLPGKTKRVLDWFADNTQPLRRVVIIIDEEPVNRHLRATHLRMHGSNDILFGL